jgi:peptidylprolyl isomerase
MENVKNGLFVSIDYKGTLQNGDIFDTSHGGQPLEIQVGCGRLIKGFEEALMGMEINEKKNFTLSPEDAYGQRDDNLSRTFDRSDVPPGMELELGQTIALRSPEGQSLPAKIMHLDDKSVELDLNHPLAGETLTFDIEVVGISETATQAPVGCGSGCDCSSGDDAPSGCDCSSGCGCG